MYDIVCSIVLFKNDKKQITDAINSFLNTDLLVKLVLIDNSPDERLKDLVFDNRIEYIFNPKNPGFGTSHNLAINKYSEKTKYFLVLNPDIYFNKGVLEDLFIFLNNNSNVGLLMPKILYPDDSIQYLAKLLPTPFIFLLKRFFPKNIFTERILNKYELRFSGYNKIIEAPYLSGCFMFFRAIVFKQIKGFDEKFFMHMEDLDISRRCYEAGYRNIFYPLNFVYHDHLYKSVLNFSNFKIYLKSAIYYFNKWGWFFDFKRKNINEEIINKIINNNGS